MSFTFKKPFSIRGKEISSQKDLDTTFLQPEDDLVKEAIKKELIGFDKAAFDKLASEEEQVESQKKKAGSSKDGSKSPE